MADNWDHHYPTRLIRSPRPRREPQPLGLRALSRPEDRLTTKPAANMPSMPLRLLPTPRTALAEPGSLQTTEARPRTAYFPNITWKRPADPTQIAVSGPHNDPPTRTRKLLDLFAGQSAPISAAASLRSIPRWEPIDIAINAQHDILQDAFFHRLLQLAWSGSIGLLVAAPPCRDYSILKLAPGGPPPCRSPKHMDGLPSNSPKLRQQALQSKTIHLRCHELCRAVAASGGIWVLENPPTSMAWLEPSCQQLLQSASAHVVHVAACAHGCTWSKAWAFASNSPHIRPIQSSCRHTARHASIRRKRDQAGNFISSQTAEYPASLAQALLGCFNFLWPQPGGPAEAMPDSPTPPTHMASSGPRAPICDGAGLRSSADCATPSHKTGPLRPLSAALQKWCLEGDRYKRITSHRGSLNTPSRRQSNRPSWRK